jgi:hypothetical protein
MVTDRLRIEPKLAPVINDYRVHDGHVEVRTLDRNGRPSEPQLSNWRPLNSNELELHFVLSTVVAKWIQHTHPELHQQEPSSDEQSELIM